MGRNLWLTIAIKQGGVRKLLCHGCNTVLGKIEKGEFGVFERYINEHKLKKNEKCHADLLLELANR